MHRDYLGSILAITDSSTNVVEQRHFGAWGEVDKFISDKSEIAFNHDTTLLNRGYTGHEHFMGVGLIHMNGRMYDAKLGRFISPDNFVQEPFNTQSFNRFGYGFNNPLKYVDPSGEFLFGLGVILSAAILGAATGAVAYAINAAITGDWSWGGFAMSIIGGAVTGALGGLVAPGMYPTIMSTAQFVGAVGIGVASGYLPTFGASIGDFSFSLSPFAAFGTGGLDYGISGSIGYRDKNVAFSIGGSIGRRSSNFGVGFTVFDNKNNQSFSAGVTFYGGKHAQTNWFAGYNKGDFSFKMTNDAGVGGDKHRTAAFELGVGNYSLGWNLYTTAPSEDEYDPYSKKRKGNDKKWKSPTWGKNTNHTYESVERIYSGFYVGIKTAKGNYRIGHDGAWSQDLFQNGIHGNVVKGPYVNTDKGSPGSVFFQFYRNQNQWSLYSR